MINNGPSSTINFLLGESKFLRFKATYTEHPEFNITSARYEIFRNKDLIEDGAMTIENHEIVMRYTPKERGVFDLYIELKVSDTIRRKHFRISVN